MAVYDSMWGERHADRCPNEEFIEKMKERDSHYDELEEAFSEK